MATAYPSSSRPSKNSRWQDDDDDPSSTSNPPDPQSRGYSYSQYPNQYSYEAFQAQAQQRSQQQPIHPSYYQEQQAIASRDSPYGTASSSAHPPNPSYEYGTTSTAPLSQPSNANHHQPYPDVDWSDTAIANDPKEKQARRISKKWQKRLYW